MREPTSIPLTFGANQTAIVQLAPTARLAPQLLRWLKKLGDTEIVVIPKALLPVFERVTF